MKGNKKKSALKVQKGIAPPAAINPNLKPRERSSARKQATYYIDGILNGERAVLSQAITLVESTLASDQQLAQKIIEACLPHSSNSLRIGITGVPGVGKSTFIEAMGLFLLEQQQNKLAVLAIDPSSARSKGSILGDKTRMEKLATHNHAFVRPSPSAGSLGGVAQKTRESIILCEAAGYNLIFVETVGVGQSETAVHSMVDFFLLLMLSGAGDELQGIKRGIMEMADAIVINKADGTNYQPALLAKAQYAQALHLFPTPVSGWTPQTAVCSSTQSSGLDTVWGLIKDYQQFTLANGYFNKKRKEQNLLALSHSIENLPYQAAEQMMQFFIEKLKKA